MFINDSGPQRNVSINYFKTWVIEIRTSIPPCWTVCEWNIKLNEIHFSAFSQSLKDLRTLHETKLKHLIVCDLEVTYASLFGDKVTKL